MVRLLDQALAENPRLAGTGRPLCRLDRRAAVGRRRRLSGLAAIAPDRALWIMVAVRWCPACARCRLATLAALTAATGHLAGIGMLTTRGHALETLGQGQRRGVR